MSPRLPSFSDNRQAGLMCKTSPGGQGDAVDALHELAQGGGVGEGLQLDRPGVVVEVDDQAHGRFLSGRRRRRQFLEEVANQNRVKEIRLPS